MRPSNLSFTELNCSEIMISRKIPTLIVLMRTRMSQLREKISGEDLSTMDMPSVYCAKMCKGLRGLTQHETHCKVLNKLNNWSWILFLFHCRQVLITKMNSLILKPSLFRLWLIFGCNEFLDAWARCLYYWHSSVGPAPIFSSVSLIWSPCVIFKLQS